MKILTYNGKDPIVVPPDHIVIFAEGSRVREAFAMAEADRVNQAVSATENCNVPGCTRPKYGKMSDRCWEHLSQGAEPASAECRMDSRIIDKAMLRESFNLAAKEVINSGAVPSAFYGALERQIFGGKA